MEKPVNFEVALKLTGYGKFNIALLIVCGSCVFAGITDSYAVSYLLPAAQCYLNLSTSDKGILSSISFIGSICSTHLWAFLSDTKGRKHIILITLFLTFTSTFLSSFARSFWIITVFKFFSGFFLSGSSATIYAYLGEFHIEKYRTITITCTSLFTAFANIVLPELYATICERSEVHSIYCLRINRAT